MPPPSPLVGVGTALRLERDASSVVKRLRQPTNEYALPPPAPAPPRPRIAATPAYTTQRVSRSYCMRFFLPPCPNRCYYSSLRTTNSRKRHDTAYVPILCARTCARSSYPRDPSRPTFSRPTQTVSEKTRYYNLSHFNEIWYSRVVVVRACTAICQEGGG